MEFGDETDFPEGLCVAGGKAMLRKRAVGRGDCQVGKEVSGDNPTLVAGCRGEKADKKGRTMIAKPKPVPFNLGQLLATPGAGQSPQAVVTRHRRGDWGEVGTHDWNANEAALRAYRSRTRCSRCATARFENLIAPVLEF